MDSSLNTHVSVVRHRIQRGTDRSNVTLLRGAEFVIGASNRAGSVCMFVYRWVSWRQSRHDEARREAERMMGGGGEGALSPSLLNGTGMRAPCAPSMTGYIWNQGLTGLFLSLTDLAIHLCRIGWSGIILAVARTMGMEQSIANLSSSLLEIGLLPPPTAISKGCGRLPTCECGVGEMCHRRLGSG